MPRASVVIPTWDGAAMLRRALASLAAQSLRDFETIVVDNGSRDGTADMLAEEFPGVVAVRFPENRGFAPAVNAGLRAARGDVLVLMNNDVEAEPGWLAALVGALERRPDVGFVASKMLSARDPTRVDSAWDAMGLAPYNVGHGETDGPRFSAGRYVLSACAGAAAYRREFFERVGYFDEDFFAWFEDVEIGVRGQLAGYRCWYEPAAVVRHLGSATAARMPDRKIFLLIRNNLILFFQTMPLRRALAWGPVILLWPWLDPIFYGRPLRLTARGWFAFWATVPRVVRNRRRIYRRPADVRALLAALENPWEDMRRAWRALPRRLGTLLRRGAEG
jgi:GT2 family glycosyltransferase